MDRNTVCVCGTCIDGQSLNTFSKEIAVFHMHAEGHAVALVIGEMQMKTTLSSYTTVVLLNLGSHNLGPKSDLATRPQ